MSAWVWLRTRLPRTRDQLATWGLYFIAWGGILAMIVVVTAPIWKDRTTWGGHDWDATTAFRYLVRKSIRRYGQFPWYDPYVGGGYSAWGFIDSDTTIVSPWFFLYLFGDLRLGLRIEVVGMALLNAWGTWLLAGRFTRSIAARAFVCVLFVVNGRWALQAASGHAWHLYYAYMPFALYFFDRSLEGGKSATDFRWRAAFVSGAFMALMIYAGAIYPLPHTVFVIAVYAGLLAVQRRSVQPLFAGAVAGAVLIGLSAPRLLPLFEGFRGAPRLTESNETMDLTVLLGVLTAPSQGFGSRPVNTSAWGWHEWGMYIGWLALGIVAWGCFLTRDARTRALKWAGIACALLAFGSFHEYAPWTLLHKLPVYASLHVPSRWLYPAALLMGAASAGALGTRLMRLQRFQKLAELGALLLVAYCGYGIAKAANEAMGSAFWMKMHAPPVEQTATFHQEQELPDQLKYVVGDWSTPALPSMIANVGVITSTAVAPVGVFAAKYPGTNRIVGQGATGVGSPNYRGEVYTLSGEGDAKFTRWTPNELDVQVDNARPGDLLIVDLNYDRGWRANGKPIWNHDNTIAYPLSGGSELVRLKYLPALLWPGLLLFLFTCAAAILKILHERRGRGEAPSHA